jgi:hypothetical protein
MPLRGHPVRTRFWHPFNLVPLVEVIAHKNGCSWRYGPRYVHFTVGMDRLRFSVDVPHTGFGWYKEWDLPRHRRHFGLLPPGCGCAVPLLGVAFALATWGTDLRPWDALGLTALGLWAVWRVASAMGRRQVPALIDAAVPPRARKARRPASAQRGLPMLPPAPRTPGTRRRRGPTG